jgi:hypothetical protein
MFSMGLISFTVYIIRHKIRLLSLYISDAFQGSTMRQSHSHLLVTFVKCEQKFCIDSQTASLYIRKSLLNRTIDSDIKVLDHILLTLASNHKRHENFDFQISWILHIWLYNLHQYFRFILPAMLHRAGQFHDQLII